MRNDKYLFEYYTNEVRQYGEPLYAELAEHHKNLLSRTIGYNKYVLGRELKKMKKNAIKVFFK